jgi:signal transduction histidine kinase
LSWQFPPILILYFIAALVSYGLAFYTWRKQPSRSQFWSLTLLSCGIWATGAGLGIASAEYEQKLFFIRYIEYLGITGTVYFWTLFAISYSRYDRWLNRYTLIAQAIVPVTAYLVVVTSPYHNLWYINPGTITQNGLVLFEKDYAAFFWIWAVYSYLVVLAGSLLLAQAVIRFPRLYQGQIFTLLVGVFTPLVANLMWISGRNPIAPYDPSSLAFVVSGIFVTIGIFRFQLFNVVPVAHDIVFQEIRNGVIVIDLREQIMDMNPVAERILRAKRADVLGHSLQDAFPSLTRIWENKDVETKVDLILDNPERGEQAYEVQVMPLTNRLGKPNGWIVLLYNVTSLKKALNERDLLIRELDAYAQTVAHDLKNPLTAIMGYAQLLQHRLDGKVSADESNYLDIMVRNSRKMQTIIEELLVLANVHSDKPVAVKELNTNALLDGALDRLALMIEETGAEIIRPSTWPTAVGYAPWVEEVWANYLSNAIKYGGQPPVIEIGAAKVENALPNGKPGVRFWIRDNGQGLSESECQDLFSEYIRLERHADADGNGLGLSIVKRIVTQLNGDVSVTSMTGVGSTFAFTLPTPEPVETTPQSPYSTAQTR